MESKSKTLLILSPGFPENEPDSTCIPPQQQFVKTLHATYPHLTIIIITFQYPFYRSEYRWHGMRVIALGGKGRGRLFRFITWLRAWRMLFKLSREHRLVGLLSFWLGECAFVAGSFSRLKGLRHYCWLLGQDARAGNKYVRWMNPLSSELIALSDFVANQFNEHYGIYPCCVIPVGIEPDLFKPVQDKRDILILGAGSLIPLKQYDLFVEIIRLLKPDCPDIKAIICGKGPEMEKLMALIRSSGLENNVFLTGELPHQKVLAFMQRTKIFLHTSSYEGFGAVCLEALYAGASVISFVKPMDTDIPNWHIASGVEDMLQTIKIILKDGSVNYQPVMPYSLTENARSMMDLFAYSEEAI